MTNTPVIPRSPVIKRSGKWVRRRTPPLSPYEAFRTVKSIRTDPMEGPCKFACGTCLLCRIHARALKDAKRRKALRKANG